MSWLSSGTKSVGNAVSGLFGGLLGYGQTPGLKNPYAPPNLDYLKDYKNLDLLKTPVTANTGIFDFLKPGSSSQAASALSKPTPDLTSSLKTFASPYKAPDTTREDLSFNDLLGSINAPSSVDQVQKGIDTETMNQLLSGIDTDTAKAIGSTKMDFLDRGLSGPGQMSDIEASALAQNRADADKNKNAARLDFANKELERQKAKELAAQDALKTRYTTNASETSQANQQENQIAAQGALADVSNYADMLKTGAGLDEAKQSALATILNNRDLSYADLLKGATDTASTQNNSNTQLLAQLLNQRDLGYATGMAGLFNSGQSTQGATQKGGILDNVLRNVQVDFKF